MKAVVVLVFLVSMVFGNEEPYGAETRLVGGGEATENQFPYHASLQWGLFDDFYSHICSATILSKFWLLTAAHCKTELPQGYYHVLAGSNTVNGLGQGRVVEGFIVHPKFKGGASPDDLALIKLESPLMMDSRVAAVSLPDDLALPGNTGIVTGWGSTVENEPGFSQSLQYMEVEIFDYQKCTTIMSSLGLNSPLAYSNVCSYAGNTTSEGVCFGDSGNPLVQNGYLIGIVGWKIFPCGSYPSVYSLISMYTQWIRQETRL